MTLASFSDFFFRSAGGAIVAALLLGAIVFLIVLLLLRVWNIRRIRTRVEPHVPARADAEEPEHTLRERLRVLGPLFAATERILDGTRLWQKLLGALARADAGLRPAEFVWVTVGAGLVLALLFALVGAPVILVVVAFLIGITIPPMVLSRKAARRQDAFDDQLADLLMTMGGSLRAGHTFRQAMQTIVDEGDEPASKEFKRVLVEIGIGRPVEEALEDMAKRMGSTNFEYVIGVVSVQREVGGNLATLFDMVSETVRQRQQFAKRVRALTATGRMSAYVVTVVPFIIVGLLTLTNRDYVEPLFTTTTGFVLIGIALVGIAIGALLMRKIVSFRMA